MSRWNKQPGQPEAHFIDTPWIKGLTFTAACGAVMAGEWQEWKVHVDLGTIPLCEGCKAVVAK